ncbi:MAG: DUF2232 domain-containing protein [Cellulosilyticaceae bacterium]
MKQEKKERIQVIGLILLYAILGVVGLYSRTMVFLFPIIALPITIYLLGMKNNLKKAWIIHVAVMISILILTGSLVECVFYFCAVAMPVTIILSLSKKSATIPQYIMYIGVGVMSVFFIVVLIMRNLGIDYINMYLEIIADTQILQMNLIDEAMTLASDVSMHEQFKAFKEVISMQYILLETIYPALFLLIGIFNAAIYQFLITRIAKIIKWNMPSFRQIAQFTFSKWMAVLFFLALILIQLQNDEPLLGLLGVNLFFFVTILLQFLGGMTAIVLIKRKKWVITKKILAYAIIGLLFSTIPTVIMMVGFSDILFNFRKVKLIV